MKREAGNKSLENIRKQRVQVNKVYLKEKRSMNRTNSSGLFGNPLMCIMNVKFDGNQLSSTLLHKPEIHPLNVMSIRIMREKDSTSKLIEIKGNQILIKTL
jgi:hypothetical protein